MENKYTAPELNVLELEDKDVIRASEQAGDNEVPLLPTSGGINDLNH